jgi:hypothetical protein
MIHHPHRLHSLGKLYQEEAFKEAWVRHLEHRVRTRSAQRSGWARVGLVCWGGTVAALRTALGVALTQGPLKFREQSQANERTRIHV